MTQPATNKPLLDQTNALLELQKRRVIPVLATEEDGAAVLVGSAVPIKDAGRYFVVTASHVLDWNGSSSLYLAMPDLVLEGSSKRTVGGDDDVFDVAAVEISRELAGLLEGRQIAEFLTRSDMAYGPLGGTVTVVGFPETRNRIRYDGSYRRFLVGFANPVGDAAAQGLDPVHQLVVPFNPKRAIGARGQEVPPDFHGVSGGPVWIHDTGGRPFLAGIVSRLHPKHHPKFIVAARPRCFMKALLAVVREGTASGSLATTSSPEVGAD